MGREEKQAASYKLLRKEGGSRVLAVGTYLPLEWQMVKVEVVRSRQKETVTLRISKVG